MTEGFFSLTSPVGRRRSIPLLPRCNECQLFKGCLSPKMPVSGKGNRNILIVGEAPGRNEDEQGRPFVGKTGQMLQEALAKAGVNMRADCWITNSIICRPPGNKLPPAAVGHCRPNVVKVITELKPEAIILVGGAAISSVIGWLWKEDVGPVDRWVGWRIPSQKLNAWVCPTWHPSYVARTENTREGEVTKLLWEGHLRRAVRHEGRPWEEVPEWDKSILVVKDHERAAKVIADVAANKNVPVAFDFETNMLKPDSVNSRIVACSVSNGTVTVAYPWHGKAITATRELILSDVPKVSSNLKFEARWAMKEFGVQVKNWLWDTMLAAHVLDNRPGISSVKFQAFVQLGVDAWDDEVKPFLKSDGSNVENRIAQAPLDKLLLYCGLDSLYEWHVAKRQMAAMGIK